MIAAAATIERMAQKKTGDGEGGARKPNRSPSYPLFARIPPALGEALDAYLASLEPRSTAAAVVELALQKLLKEKGFWPPKQQDQPEGGEA